jgi:hypothetical protein
MGLGGYPTAIPKWKNVEQELIDRGLVPESLDWPERAKHWFFAHGGRLDLETRKVVYGERIQAVAERFHQAGYASVSVDRVVKGHENVALDIEGGDREKTLGEAEKTFICWKKWYIIIPRAPPPQPNPMCG